MSHSNTLSLDPAIVAKQFRQIFDKTTLSRLAFRTNFVSRRSSKLQGHEIALTLIEKGFNADKCPLSICCDAIAEINPKAEMTVQSLSERINSVECVNFFKTILIESIQQNLQKNENEMLSNLPPMGKSAFYKFASIKALDCTEIALNPLLRESFKGSGGEKNAEACLKIFTGYNLTLGSFFELSIADRGIPDQILGRRLTSGMQPNELYLMDKGFFSTELLEAIEDKEAYYITPLHASVNVYRELDGDPVVLSLYILKHFKKSGFFDKKLYLGKNKRSVRIVAFPLSEGSQQKKLKNYLKRCRKEKRAPSDESIARQGMLILVTNICSEPPNIIVALYRLRWQLELIFKSWKSQLKVDWCKGSNSKRIKVLIYSRLIAISMIGLAFSTVGIALEAYNDKEMSFFKAVNWLLQGNRVYRLLSGDCKVIEALFKAAEKWLCKESNRKRKTTRQLLNDLSENNLQVA